MPWKFDPFIIDIVWTPPGQSINELADITFGETTIGDLEIEMGERNNDVSEINQGFRVFENGDI